MLRLQPRSIPCSRGMGRKRNNGRNPSPGIYAREYLAFNRPDNVGEALAAAQTASAARGEGDHPRRRRIAAPTRRQTVANAISFWRAQIGLPRGAIILPPRGSLSAAFARSNSRAGNAPVRAPGGGLSMREHVIEAARHDLAEAVKGRYLCGAVSLEIDFPARWAWHDHSHPSRVAHGAAYATLRRQLA